MSESERERRRLNQRNADIYRALMDGCGPVSIGNYYGLHRMTIYRIGISMGWTPRRYPIPPGGTKKRNQEIRSAAAKGASLAELAREHGVSRQRVFQIVNVNK